MQRRLIGFLAAGAAGVLMTLAGLVWDVALHSADHELAAHESPFSLGNPAHLLAALGVAVTTVSVAGALATAWRGRSGETGRAGVPAWGVAVAGATLALVAGAAGASALGGDEGGGGQALAAAHDHEAQYPDVAAASASERAAAQSLLDRTRAATARFADPGAARAAGYRVDATRRNRKGRIPLALHAGNPAFRRDGRVLDPTRPETLVYGRKRDGGALVLVGVMYSVPPGQDAPAPGGPITRWHSHREGGPQMMHVWFTGDLRSAFARRIPKEIAQRYDVRVPPRALPGGRG
jgi:hypothetical protein